MSEPPSPRWFIDVTSAARSTMQTGIQRVVRGLYRHLQPHGFQALVWDPSGGAYRFPRGLEQRCLARPFAPGLHRFRSLVRLSARFGGPLPRLRPSDDLILVPEVFGDGRIAHWRERRTRGVAIVHDLITHLYPRWTPPHRQQGFEDYLRALESMDRLVCVSEATRHDIETYARTHFQEIPDLAVLHWPVDDDFVPPLSEAIRHNLPIPEVLCVSRLEPRKNHLLLLEAADMLWEEGLRFRLVLAGRRLRGQDEAVLQRIRALRRRGHPIEWYPDPDDEGLRHLYLRAAFTVFPSRAEGFGLPILESVAMGRPCICSGKGAAGEVARAGGCLTVDVDLVRDLARAMADLLSHPGMASQLAEEARARKVVRWPEYILALQPHLNSPS